jgi:hypothetical protein
MLSWILAEITQGADHLPIWPNRVFNVISTIVVWQLALFANYWKTHPTSFTFQDWWRDDKTRFIGGCIVTVGLVVLKATSQSVDEMLKLLGFQVSNTSGVAYGLAIAAFLLGFKPAAKKEEVKS